MTIQLPEIGALGVSVREDITFPIIFDGKLCDNWQDEEIIPIETLPEGTWSLIKPVTVDKYTWQDCVEIVESEHDGSESLKRWYRDYEWKDVFIRDPKASLSSLLSKYNLSESKTILLIKK